MVAPVLEELSDEMSGEIKIGKINIEDSPNVPVKYGIRGVPTLLLFLNGEVADSKVGASSKEDIRAWAKSKIG